MIKKKCSQNSHYELCGSGCPLTCSGPSSPAGCDAPCTEGCFCDRGFLLSGDKCVPVADCGCVQNNTYYPTGQNFYLGDTCTSRCNCNKNGTLDCQASSCGANELCKVANGVRGCYPAEVSQCVATGDPHYRSFDGWSFEFQGTCTYILAQLQSNLPQVPNFSVTVKNERYGTTSASVAKTVMVIVDRYNITLDRGIRWKVKVNDLLYVLPLKLSPRDIQINQEGNNIIIVTSFGLKVLYDAMYYIRVEVPSTWKGQMRGLCGNFNGDRNDDFQLPNGGRASNVDDFGAAWQVDVKEANCSRGCGNNCPTCSAANTQKYSSSLSCGMINDPSGPFRLCHGQVNPTDYLNFCLYDLCSVTDQTDLLCKNLQAYAAACQAAGTKVMPWRSATFCPLACPSKSHYDLCTSTCGETCASVTESSKCSGQCFEGCSCDSGFMFDGESCVPRDNCGCVYNGQYIPRGESVVSADCSKQCTCMSGKVGVQCSEYGCDRGSVCTVNDGLRGCYIQYIQCTFPLEAIVSTIGNVSKISFDLSHTCTTKNPYYYTLMVNYDPTIQPGGIAIAYIKKGFTSELRSNQQVKVNNAIAKLPYTDSNGLAIKTVEDGLMLDQASVLRLTLSFNGTVALAVNPTIDACGPCTDSKNTAISSIQVGNQAWAGEIWKFKLNEAVLHDINMQSQEHASFNLLMTVESRCCFLSEMAVISTICSSSAKR
ncbi:hypothetical protein NDU88_010648 [Pleurodeles waltl]|uniref:VWFD domain-containing protein n=1 Tax=Pleurodeles waltl TaxID=8319 RepID=A0AAV7PYN6_PLEWA|nr:hypothetical protein NDU88_010648 [Pleurodeles waltl]